MTDVHVRPFGMRKTPTDHLKNSPQYRPKLVGDFNPIEKYYTRVN